MSENRKENSGSRPAIEEAVRPKDILANKYDNLLEILCAMRSVVVAFSGGVDSALVAKAAFEALGEKAVAVTAVSATLSRRERTFAKSAAELIGIGHVELAIDELASSEFVANDKYRCYHCKRLRMSRLKRYAADEGFAEVVDGTNADDPDDWRPGLKANEELGIRSPLLEAGMTKSDARRALEALNMPFWNKPSSPCLASRIPYGSTITKDKLAQIEAAEEAVWALGVTDVRVRHHGSIARIEVPRADLKKVVDADGLTDELRRAGFAYVALDLDGLSSGSLNRSAETPRYPIAHEVGRDQDHNRDEQMLKDDRSRIYPFAPGYYEAE